MTIEIAVEKVIDGLNKKNGAEVACTLGSLANGSMKESFCEQLAKGLEKEGINPGDFTILSLAWIKKLSAMYDAKRMDGRNEAACEFGKVVETMVPELSLWPKDKECLKWETARDFASVLSFEHRTLQQAVTKMLCKWLEEFAVKESGPEAKLAELIIQKVPSDIRKFPFI